MNLRSFSAGKLLIALFVLIMSSSQLFSGIAAYHVWVEDPSSTCKYGRSITFQDTNGDGLYDWILKTNCDGTAEQSPFKMFGTAFVPQEGMKLRELSGTLSDDSFVVELYIEDATGETTIGYLVKEPGIEDVTFYSDVEYQE